MASRLVLTYSYTSKLTPLVKNLSTRTD
uniref:Uncharacterized protein n=1 Tax=Zea mays TaxID=4577 RepID=C4J061_MAIZE|nr:unknown [Zea mays]